MNRQQTKTHQYIQQLNDARCEGNWEAVPELVRKVRKHGPERSCLALTAETECFVAQSHKSNPPSTTSSTKSSTLLQLIPPLLEAVEKERTFVEDEFQAQVCLGWIHWLLDEPDLTIARLPKDIDHDFAELDGTGKESAGWTRVCAVKGAYLKGASFSKRGADSEALQAFNTGMPILSLEGSNNLGYELQIWTELLLSNVCLLYSKTLTARRTRFFETETLSAFRSWVKFWNIQSGSDSAPGGFGIQVTVSRRYIWRQYYLALSNLLQKGQHYPTSSFFTSYVDDSAKLRQSTELEKVQTIYEGLLLKEVQFPKAEEGSEEVEQWVETVVQNWSLLCGSSWQENELPKGKERTSRHVLDILYRAATKTFHSTRILRYLFKVHLAVADFDLAFKAFDTYLDIVKKGKAREEKTGEAENALDDDETVLMTAAECIRALCRYNSRHGAEKARDLGRYLEDWLKKHGQVDAGSPRINGNGLVAEKENKRGTTVSLHATSKAWLAVGISQAQWARFTYESASRSDIQLHAVECFRKALSPELKNTNDVEALFALGILLSERRELDAAIKVVKSALLPSGSSIDSTSRDLGPYQGDFARERSLIPLWHLLALLLSARQEFTTAARACEGAFEQFRDPTNLFGQTASTYRSDHLNEKTSKTSLGAVDIMEDIEKETILEVKITQLALIEILEGPEVAVNASDELLSLYARLFGAPDKSLSSVPSKTANEPPPRSSAGTIRTLGGSLFRRSSKSNRRHSKTPMNEKGDGAVASVPPQTSATQAPTIQVTNDGTSRQRVQTTRARSTHRQEKLQKPRNRSSSLGKAIHLRNSTGISSGPSSTNFSSPSSSGQRDQWADGESSMVGVAISSEGPHVSNSPKSNTLAPASQNMQQTELPLRGSGNRQLDNRLPQSFIRNPTTCFPKRQERQRRLGTLVRLWLLVAGFYRRATMLEDASGALEEARKLVEGLEMDISKDQSREASVKTSGWGGGKSVEELWGDVWAERGQLSLAKGLPHTAQADYEAGLTSFADHPTATIGLSNILLDTYSENILPPSSTSSPPAPTSPAEAPNSNITMNSSASHGSRKSSTPSQPPLISSPLGLPITKNPSVPIKTNKTTTLSTTASSTALLDRLAARDRAYGLLSALTKSGGGWNNSEAWFALARAYEEGGEIEKSRECLWWCIELEEARGVRGWDCVAASGYVL